MSEFKVDKLGWYENRRGDIYKVVHLLESAFLAVHKSNTGYLYGYLNGKGGKDREDLFDLIKYLGPELPKEPRMYKNIITTNKDVFDIKISLKKDNNFNCENISFATYEPKSNWEITVKEVIE